MFIVYVTVFLILAVMGALHYLGGAKGDAAFIIALFVMGIVIWARTALKRRRPSSGPSKSGSD